MNFLKFFNLVDCDGNLSITNIAVIVGITKMAYASQMSSPEVIALIGVLLNYAHKRTINAQDSSNGA